MEMLDDLIALMEIPSVTGGEEMIAAYLGERLAAGGRPIVRDGSSVLVPPPSDDRPLVVLAGHLDTVPPRGNAHPRVEGSTVWGRGAADMKGGIAVLISLMDAEDVGAGWVRVGAVLYSGEEGPLVGNDLRRILSGSFPWMREAGLAILLEPTENVIEAGCLGVVNLDVIFRGEACHSARPWLGTNAIGLALPWLSMIRDRPFREHEIAGLKFRETANVTTVSAGTARNVIPGELIANLNYRFPPGWDTKRGVEEAMRLVARASEVRLVDVPPSGAVPSDQPLFAAFVERSGAACRGKQAWTDVAQFSELGVPALNFGPGNPHLAHKDDERVELAALEQCREILHDFLTGEAPEGRTLG